MWAVEDPKNGASDGGEKKEDENYEGGAKTDGAAAATAVATPWRWLRAVHGTVGVV